MRTSLSLQALVKPLFYTSILLCLFSYWSFRKAKQFPENLTYHPEVLRGPIQNTIAMNNFSFEHEGRSFELFPKAHYQLAGLIVSHNDVKSITDAYHTSESVDVRDICVVWGSNLASGVFRRAKYHSEPWTCVIQFDERGDQRKFSPSELSNTHILTAKKEVRDKIWKTRIGDQVVAKGVLVDYCPAGKRDYLRKTSLIRHDTGNGACEVMFVNSFEIVKRMNTFWYKASSLSWYISLAGFGLLPLFFVFGVLGESRARTEKVRNALVRRRKKLGLD